MEVGARVGRDRGEVGDGIDDGPAGIIVTLIVILQFGNPSSGPRDEDCDRDTDVVPIEVLHTAIQVDRVPGWQHRTDALPVDGQERGAASAGAGAADDDEHHGDHERAGLAEQPLEATAARPTVATTSAKHGNSDQRWLVGNAPRIGAAAIPVISATTNAKARTIGIRPLTAAVSVTENNIDAIKQPPMSVGSSSRPTSAPVRSEVGSGAIVVVVNVRPTFSAAVAKPPRTYTSPKKLLAGTVTSWSVDAPGMYPP